MYRATAARPSAAGMATRVPSGRRPWPPLPRRVHRAPARAARRFPHRLQPSATSPRARLRQPLPVQERAAATPKVRPLRELPQCGRRGRDRHPRRRCRWL